MKSMADVYGALFSFIKSLEEGRKFSSLILRIFMVSFDIVASTGVITMSAGLEVLVQYFNFWFYFFNVWTRLVQDPF